MAQNEADEQNEEFECVLPPRSHWKEQERKRALSEAGEDPALTRALATAKKRKRKTKRKAFFDPKDTLILLGGILGVVLLLSFLGWGYPYFRWPFGLMLLCLGFVTYLMGVVSLQELIADKSAFTLMLFRIFPPFQWLIIVNRWAEAKDFAAFFVSGGIILGLGCGLIARAPGGKYAPPPTKTARTKVQPAALPRAPSPESTPKEEAKPAASTPKTQGSPPTGAPKEQVKPATSTPKAQAPPPTGAPKEQVKPATSTPKAQGPPPTGAPKEQVKPTGSAPASAPAQAQPKPQPQPPPGSTKPAGDGQRTSPPGPSSSEAGDGPLHSRG
jgi:hypothetical protein